MDMLDVFVAEGVPRFLVFVLVLFRVMSLFVVAPFFGSESIPPAVKIGLAGLTAMVLVPAVHVAGDELPRSLAGFFMAVLLETGVGLVMGLSASLVFSSLQMTGHYIGQQIGLTIANVIDPISNDQVSLMGQFKFLMGIFIFLGMDAHLFLLRVLAQSFVAVPLMGAHYPWELMHTLAFDQFAAMFATGVVLAAPAMVALLLITVGEGFIARTVPEINIFIVGFALRVGLGLGILLLSLPYLMPVVATLFEHMERDVLDIVVILRG